LRAGDSSGYSPNTCFSDLVSSLRKIAAQYASCCRSSWPATSYLEIEPTDEGQRLLNASRERAHAIERQFARGLSPEEQKLIKRRNDPVPMRPQARYEFMARSSMGA
jgi:hypothetical protein